MDQAAPGIAGFFHANAPSRRSYQHVFKKQGNKNPQIQKREKRLKYRRNQKISGMPAQKG